MDWLTGFFSWLFGRSADSKTVAKVQATTVKLCGFLPMAETVAKLIALGNPTVDMVAIIARKICTAVSKAQSANSLVGAPVKPVVDGIVIEGEFVK